jgi:hypothetical protein
MVWWGRSLTSYHKHAAIDMCSISDTNFKCYGLPTTLPGVSPTSSYSRRTASCYKHQPHYREFHRLVHIQDGLLRDDL